jgi:hypothetical protein
MALLLQLHPQYFTSLWAGKRLASFAVIGMFGVIPSLHWTWIHGGFTQNIVQVQWTTIIVITTIITIITIIITTTIIIIIITIIIITIIITITIIIIIIITIITIITTILFSNYILFSLTTGILS